MINDMTTIILSLLQAPFVLFLLGLAIGAVVVAVFRERA